MKRFSIVNMLVVSAFLLTSCSVFKNDEKIKDPIVIPINKAGGAGSIKTNFAAENIVGNFKYEENIITGQASPKLFVEAVFFDSATKNPMFEAGADLGKFSFHSVGPNISFYEAEIKQGPANKALPSNTLKMKHTLRPKGEPNSTIYPDLDEEVGDDQAETALQYSARLIADATGDKNGKGNDPTSDQGSSNDETSDTGKKKEGDQTDDAKKGDTDQSGDKPTIPISGSEVMINEQINKEKNVVFYLTPGNATDLLPSINRKHSANTQQIIKVFDNGSNLTNFALPFTFPQASLKLTGESGKGGTIALVNGEDFSLTWEPGPDPESIISIAVEIREKIKDKPVVIGNLVIYSKDTGSVSIKAKEFAKLPDGEGIASISRTITGNIKVSGETPTFINYKSSFRTLFKSKKADKEKKK